MAHVMTVSALAMPRAATAPAARRASVARPSASAAPALSFKRAAFATGGARFSERAAPIKASRAATAPRVSANLTFKEEKTGIEYPLVTMIGGVEQRCLGAGVRTKKVLVVNAKVYVVALYVEPEPAAKELGLRDRGGFFKADPEDSMADALMDGAFQKALSIQMCRKVEGAQFYEAIQEVLAPRMFLMGETSSMEQFKGAFEGRTLDKGTTIVINWSIAGDMDLSINGEQVLNISSPGLCRAIFEVYLGSKAVCPPARTSFTEGAFKLLDSENVKRSTRKGGSG